MIPLSQYLSDGAGEDFTPLMALAARKAAANTASSSGKLRPLKVLPKAAEPAPVAPAPAPAPVATRPAFAAPAAPRLVTEPRVPLRELEAEKAARAADEAAHQAELVAAVEAARMQGIEIGRALAHEDYEPELAGRIAEMRREISEESNAAIAEMRGRWTSEQADRLADLMIMQVSILEEALKLNLGNILRPLALDVRRRQTVDEMVGAVRTLALDGTACRISASGPADLLEALEQRLGDEVRLVSFTPDENKTDIRIDADATVIESRLSSWRSALEEALS